MTREYHLHLISDATGETLNTVAKAVAAQFEGNSARSACSSRPCRTQGTARDACASPDGRPPSTGSAVVPGSRCSPLMRGTPLTGTE